VVDALIIFVGLALLCWLFLVLPEVTNPSVPGQQRLIDVGYPVSDLLVLATLVQLLAPGAVRGASVVLLIIATVSNLASDAGYQSMQYTANHHFAEVITLGWLVGSIVWGAAALHPSMTELTAQATRREPTASPAKIIALMLTSLVPPIFLLIRSVERRDGDGRRRWRSSASRSASR
jgi:hypothetical protein